MSKFLQTIDELQRLHPFSIVTTENFSIVGACVRRISVLHLGWQTQAYSQL
jgi:hypothetical protein